MKKIKNVTVWQVRPRTLLLVLILGVAIGAGGMVWAENKGIRRVERESGLAAFALKLLPYLESSGEVTVNKEVTYAWEEIGETFEVARREGGSSEPTHKFVIKFDDGLLYGEIEPGDSKPEVWFKGPPQVLADDIDRFRQIASDK